jgi:hypothetical protein
MTAKNVAPAAVHLVTAQQSMKLTPVHTASYVIAAAILLGTVHLRLVSALFAGMLVHTLIHNVAPLLARLFSGRTGRMAVVPLP